jgi:DNA end-binding protein Ku
MARRLVETLETSFDPTKYSDTYRARVEKLIKQKAAGKEPKLPEAPEETGPPDDLMAALEASLNA